MAAESRLSADSLNRLTALQKEPHRFNYFAAIRLLDCIYSNLPCTGNSDRPSQEAVRIGQTPYLSFAPSSLSEFAPPSGNQYWQLRTYMFGLLGPNAPLPIHMTEFAMGRISHHRDKTFARFLDVFHHRLAAFFYRAWAISQPVVQLDRAHNDRFADYVGSLSGYGMPKLKQRDAMPDEAKRFFAAHLGNFRRHESGLQSILEAFFGAVVSIRQFIGHWIDLPDDCRNSLGKNRETGVVGHNMTLGSRVYDYQSKFRIIVGPVNYALYCSLLPYGSSMRRLRSIVDAYVGLELSWDVQLKLKKEEVKPFVLGKQGHLGWTSWLHSSKPARDGDQLIVDPVKKLSRANAMASRDQFLPHSSLPDLGVTNVGD